MMNYGQLEKQGMGNGMRMGICAKSYTDSDDWVHFVIFFTSRTRDDSV